MQGILEESQEEAVVEDILMDEKEQADLLVERYGLALERIREIPKEAACPEAVSYTHLRAHETSV